MWNVNLTSRLSTSLIGILIFFVPFITYLDRGNLRQLSESDVLEIFISQSVIIFLIFIFSYFFEKIFRSLFKKNIFLFPFLGLAFYLNFHYVPLFNLTQEFLFAQFNFRAPIGIYFFVAFEIFCLGVILIGLKYLIFSLRMIMIFSILMITISAIPIVSFLQESNSNKTSNSYLFQTETFEQDHSRVKRNIYFVILDAMVGLDTLEPFNIVSKKEVIDKLKDNDLTYIDKSHSSYSDTKFSLTSLLLLDYHQKPSTPKYTDTTLFFPDLMYNFNVEIPLFAFLEKANSTFFWAPGENYDCVPTSRWNCIDNNQNNLSFSLNLWNFYLTTPAPKIFKRYFKNIKSQDTIGPFLEYINLNGIPKEPFFVYIHHNIPHGPHLVTAECDETNYNDQSFEGYKSSYHCALKMILTLTEKINKLDPDAIIIFQGDHGLRKFLNLNLTVKEKHLFTGSIFNSIKAPDSCFVEYGLPRTTINSIRFALNCAYGFKLPFKENIHYYSKDHGIVVERKLY